MSEYKIVIDKTYGPFIYEYNSYEEAVTHIEEKWFGPGVWDIKLFKNNEEIDISEIVKSFGTRPIY